MFAGFGFALLGIYAIVDQMKEQAATERKAETTVEVEKTGETETIGGYECEKINVSFTTLGNTMVIEQWMAKDVEGIDDAPAFAALAEAALAAGKGVVDVVTRQCDPEGVRVIILSGSGNNGSWRLILTS